MGKKRIKEQSAEEKGADVKKPSEKKTGGISAVRKGIAHIQATYNNTMVSMSDEKGNILAWASAGAIGFRGTKKSTPYAAARVAEALVDKLGKISIPEDVVLVKGVGSGRESAIRALTKPHLYIAFIKYINH